jgi:hypothetical protein
MIGMTKPFESSGVCRVIGDDVAGIGVAVYTAG